MSAFGTPGTVQAVSFGRGDSRDRLNATETPCPVFVLVSRFGLSFRVLFHSRRVIMSRDESCVNTLSTGDLLVAFSITYNPKEQPN